MNNCHRFRNIRQGTLRGLLFLSLLLVSSTFLLAGDGIEQYLPKGQGYDYARSQNASGLADAAKAGPFDSQILQEYVIRSYSHWRVIPAGSTQPVAGMDVFEMLDPPAAYGLFSIWGDLTASTAAEKLDLGVDNRYEKGQLAFWKGNYFIELKLRKDAPVPQGREVLLNVSRSLVESIKLPNAYPLTIENLPKEGLQAGSQRFYLGKAALTQNPAFPKSLIPVIGFENNAEVAFAQYGPDKGSLFIVGYPTPALAKDYVPKLEEALQTYFSRKGAYMRRSGYMVSLFFGNETEARQVLSQINYAPNIKWVYQKKSAETVEKPAGKGWTWAEGVSLVLRLMLGTIGFLLVALVIGLVFGVLRYRWVKRHPTTQHTDVMVNLNLSDRGGIAHDHRSSLESSEAHLPGGPPRR